MEDEDRLKRQREGPEATDAIAERRHGRDREEGEGVGSAAAAGRAADGAGGGAPRGVYRSLFSELAGVEEGEGGEVDLGDDDEDDDEDDALGFDSDDWIRRQRANNVAPEDVLSQLGISVTVRAHARPTRAAPTLTRPPAHLPLSRTPVPAQHAASPDELWRLVAVLVSQLRTRMLPRQRLGAPHSSLDDAVRLLGSARSVLVVSGAGISVSAGIPDFRSANGVYQMVEERFNLPDPQSLFDIHFFANDPEPFFSFAKNIYPGVFQPTPCHRFIRALERRGRLLRNYTQNIDTLEKVAGIVRKVTCHGSFETASCLACKRSVSCDEIRPQIESGVVPRCGACAHPLGILKPDIVFFGESLGESFERHIQRDLPRCDALLVVGSSMRVQPVAAIPAMLPADVPQILINRELVLQPHQFDIELLGEGLCCCLFRLFVSAAAGGPPWHFPSLTRGLVRAPASKCARRAQASATSSLRS